MKKNVYKIIWADDEIDSMLTKQPLKRIKQLNIEILGMARSGHELKELLSKHKQNVDAVVVDFNFNEFETKIKKESDGTGFEYARKLCEDYSDELPFFLLTGRSEEMIYDKYEDNPQALEKFKRHERWFEKHGEEEELYAKIIETVDEINSPEFIVRNKYREALNCAILNRKANEELFPLLLAEHENCLEQFSEPFVTCRKIIEEVFKQCEECNLIPPISEDVNGTSKYFSMDKYSGDYGSYENKEEPLMKRPLARALYYLIDITQDGAHNKKNMKLKVDEYWQQTKDTYLLRSILFITCDILRWFAQTFIDNHDKERNALRWDKINTALQTQCKEGK